MENVKEIPFTSKALGTIARNFDNLDVPLFLGEPGDRIPVASTDGDIFIIEIHDSWKQSRDGSPSFTWAELI